PADLSVALGVQALLDQVDETGRADRERWIAALRSALPDRLGAASPAASPHGPSNVAAIDGAVDDLLRRLEEAGIARRVPTSDDWQDVRIADGLQAAALEEHPFQAEVEKVVRLLQEGGPNAFRGPEAGTPPGLENGSQLRATRLVKVYRKRKVVNEVD